MTFRQPTFAGELCTTTNDLRLMQAGIVCGEGVGSFEELLVSATSPVSGAVTISEGHAFIANDNGGGAGGMYHVYNDAPVVLDVPLNSTGSNRTDVVWVQVCDSEYGGVSGATPVYDDNNPTATPPADGCTYYQLATVVVPDGAGSGGTNITGTPTAFGDTDGMVTDQRAEYYLCGYEFVRVSAVLDFPAITAGGIQELVIPVPGVTVGDPIAVGPPTTVPAGVVWGAYVTGPPNDSVTIRLTNITAAPINPASATWTVAVRIR